MRSLVAVLLLAALATATVYQPTLASFRQWSAAHGKVYTRAELPRRFMIFKENLAVAERLNIENHGAVFSANKFADLTNEEFKALYASGLRSTTPVESFAVTADDSNAAADFRYMLPAVKDQAQCGSCWAFSAIANAEGQTYQKTGFVIALSEQALVSCDRVDAGCNGGNMYTGDEYLVKHGAASEAAYPYASATGVAPACKKFTPVATFTSYNHFGRISSDATIIKHIDTYGPLSVAIEADRNVFQLYTSGVLDSGSCGTTLDHGVTLVGYGTDEITGKNYWTVRNSWGAAWGEDGYIRMVRGKNMCGINSDLCTIIA